MSWQDALLLHESSDAGDVSQAWLVWSGTAETALADAYRFSGGPPPNRGLVLGRGRERFRVVRLGGHEVRKVVLLMRMMPLTFSCTAILLALPCLT